VPAVRAVTSPVDKSMFAIVVLLLNQVPPGAAFIRVAVCPRHSSSVPEIVEGRGFIVTVAVVKQPAGSVYVIVAMPALIPVTTPVEPIVAIPVLLLLHVPPVLASVSVVVCPLHICCVPEIVDGEGLTVTSVALMQPTGETYHILAPPGLTPVIIPVGVSTIALLALVYHVPPEYYCSR